jgi:hypothetical protein
VILLLTAITAMSGQKKTLTQQSVRAINVWCSTVYDDVVGSYVLHLMESLTVPVWGDYMEQKNLRCDAGYSLKELLYAGEESVSFQHRCIRYQ